MIFVVFFQMENVNAIQGVAAFVVNILLDPGSSYFLPSSESPRLILVFLPLLKSITILGQGP